VVPRRDDGVVDEDSLREGLRDMLTEVFRAERG
jgi:hypothetical protein